MNLRHRLRILERLRPPVIAWEGPLTIVRGCSDNPRIPRGVAVRITKVTRLGPDENESSWTPAETTEALE